MGSDTHYSANKRGATGAPFIFRVRPAWAHTCGCKSRCCNWGRIPINSGILPFRFLVLREQLLFLMPLAGTRPGGRPPFLLVQERRQRTRPQVCDPCAALRGKPVSGRLRGVPQNSLRATRSVQTTAANQFTMHARCALRSNNRGKSDNKAWALRRPCHPASTPPQAQPQGVDSPTRAIAALGLVRAPHRIGASAAMARVVG